MCDIYRDITASNNSQLMTAAVCGEEEKEDYFRGPT